MGGGGTTFTLKQPYDGAWYYYPVDSEGNQIYFALNADGGLNNVRVTWSFPDMPSLNGEGTIPAFSTTQEQISNNEVPYFEYVYSNGKVTGLHCEANDFYDLFVSIKSGTNSYTRRNYSPAIDVDISFDEPVDEEDIIELVFSDSSHAWYCYNFSNSSPILWINHRTESMLVDGKATYDKARFLRWVLFPQDENRPAEAQHMTNEGTITIPGGGYTLVDSNNQSLGEVAQGESRTFQLKPYHYLGADWVEYEPVQNGTNIYPGGNAETGLNGRTITWTFPSSLNMSGSAVIPNYKSVSQQMAECVPYVEVITSGDVMTGVRYRLVKADDTSTAITPDYRIDFHVAVFKIGDKTAPGHTTQEFTAQEECTLDESFDVRNLDHILAQIDTYEDPDNPCVYTWTFSTSSLEDLPRAGIMQVTPEELGIDTLNAIVRNIASIDSVSDLHFLTDDEVLGMSQTTDAIEQAVKDDNHELVGRLNMVQVSETGYYVMKIVLTDELFNALKDTDIDLLKVYALIDTELQDSDLKSSIINGILNTWEILTMTGNRPTKIDAPTLLLVGLLNASQPFSVFIGKLILSVLGLGGGGCSAGISLAGVAAVIFFAVKRCAR